MAPHPFPTTTTYRHHRDTIMTTLVKPINPSPLIPEYLKDTDTGMDGEGLIVATVTVPATNATLAHGGLIDVSAQKTF